MATYKELVGQRKQTEAEIDALQLLWSGMIKRFTPERKRFDAWLQTVGYVETIHCINQTGQQFIRDRGLTFPNQTLRYMDCAVNRTLIRLRKAEESRKELQR